MEFGIQFFPNVSPDEKDAATYFRESILLAEEAEQQGFTHARVVEHYFERYGGYSPNPIVFLSALSQRTRTMRMVTGAVLPVFNHPLKLAGEIGMLDGISNGRLDVGFARAFLPHEFRRFGISPDESQARYREAIEQIDLLLTRERVSHAGRFHSFDTLTSLPRPTQAPRPKFYVAAIQSVETFEFAGEMGYSLMAIPIGGAKIKPLFEAYRAAWRKAGHPGDGEIMVAFHMFCHEDGEAARRIARGPFEAYFTAMVAVTKDWTEGTQSKDYRGYDESMEKLKSVTLESQIDSAAAWVGTPDEVKALIEKAVDLLGPFEHASLQINFGNMGYEDARRSLRLFGGAVVPALA